MKELSQAINSHLASEFQASHTYLAMSIWLREKDLAGFSTYMLDKSRDLSAKLSARGAALSTTAEATAICGSGALSAGP